MRVTEVTDVKDDTQPRHWAPVLWPYVLVMASWTLALVATLTNQSYLINHHYLLEQSHLPLLVALVGSCCWMKTLTLPGAGSRRPMAWSTTMISGISHATM